MMPNGQHPGFLQSFGCALKGIAEAVRTERNVKVMLAVGVAAVLAGILLRLDALGWAVIVIDIGLVLMGELLNTAVETVVDLASPEYHPLARRAKDIAAGAMFVASLAAAVSGIIVYARAAAILLTL